jgi:hypothetical protein
MLFVRPGGRNHPALPIYATFFTDSEGVFALQLPSRGVFAVVTREKGESRQHVYLRGKETERAHWLAQPAFLIDTHACTADQPYVIVQANGSPPLVASPTSTSSSSSASIPTQKPQHASKDHESTVSRRDDEYSNALFVSDQRDPTLPSTHTRDFILGS